MTHFIGKTWSRRAVLLAPLTLPVLVSGCGVLPGAKPPPKLYTLSPKSTFPEDLPVANWQLGIERPTAPAGLSTAKIAATRQPLQLDYYAGVVWVDDAPHMVQRLMIESFENSGKIVGLVGREAVGLRSNFVPAARFGSSRPSTMTERPIRRSMWQSTRSSFRCRAALLWR